MTHFSTNWLDQKQRNLHVKWPPLNKTFQAQTRKISFTYPFSWYEGINVWPNYVGQGSDGEFGYVSTAGWQTGPNSPIGIWFFVGEEPMPTACYEDVKLVSIVSDLAVSITGLTQKVYYCETITSPAYDSTKFIANFGLVSVHMPKPNVRFSLAEYLACHPSADNWFVYDAANPTHVLFQFGGHTFGLVPPEASQAFSSQADALTFFSSADYLEAKKIILSTWVG